MKYLTKKWAKKYLQVKFIFNLKEIDTNAFTCESLNQDYKQQFFDELKKDQEMFDTIFSLGISEKYYSAKIKRNQELIDGLELDINNKLKNAQSLIYGYAIKEDKALLFDYAYKVLKEIETLTEKARVDTESVINFLPEEFDVEEFIEDILLGTRVVDNSFYLDFDGASICVENIKILQDDGLCVNKWDFENPLSAWTHVQAIELCYNEEKRFELHLLLCNGNTYEDVTFWCLTIQGTNVKVIK